MCWWQIGGNQSCTKYQIKLWCFVNLIILKVHFVILTCYFYNIFSRYRQNMIFITIFFNCRFWGLFLIYTCLPVLYSFIDHYVGNYNVNIINQWFSQLFYQTNQLARNILDTNNMYLHCKGFYWCKNSL